jgi:hypothetical protein
MLSFASINVPFFIVMLGVIMLSVAMLSVAAPLWGYFMKWCKQKKMNETPQNNFKIKVFKQKKIIFVQTSTFLAPKINKMFNIVNKKTEPFL